jgi:hypothetical protein
VRATVFIEQSLEKRFPAVNVITARGVASSETGEAASYHHITREEL